MGTITRIHFNDIVDDLDEFQIRELVVMLQEYLSEGSKEQ